MNYNEWGDRPHTVTLYVDGVVATWVNSNARSLGTNFLRDIWLPVGGVSNPGQRYRVVPLVRRR